jgi:hypothetical protein
MIHNRMHTIKKNRREQKGKPKWALLSYAGHDMKNLRCKKQNTNTYNNSGIYKLKSLDCSMKYEGQTCGTSLDVPPNISMTSERTEQNQAIHNAI